ncbi:hypothetical protein [Propionispora hippei]|uniref:Uncharacterized protein n=1 Tax=Propionispora hippei DSM 15287 TaxID=1123003 RepID=A0A1M6DV70_9FIRM|nr:hypothetical protein [Propionispora hippei]SHI77043.1 hypothetical protein SAMN02745170_01010 [Propionispora hippei DSM 15287]
MPAIESKQEQSERQEAKAQERYERKSRGQRMRERISETTNVESSESLDQIFEAKLAAVSTYERKLATITDPYARSVLQDMIRQERRELMHLTELADFVEQSPDMNGFTRAHRRMGHRMKMKTGHSPAFWLGTAALGMLLLPSVREKLRPLAIKTVQGIMGLSEQAQGVFSGVREDLEDIVSEAQFEQFKQSIDSAIEETVPEPTEPAP